MLSHDATQVGCYALDGHPLFASVTSSESPVGDDPQASLYNGLKTTVGNIFEPSLGRASCQMTAKRLVWAVLWVRDVEFCRIPVTVLPTG